MMHLWTIIAVLAAAWPALADQYSGPRGASDGVVLECSTAAGAAVACGTASVPLTARGAYAQVSVAPTVTAGAYASGNVIGGLLTFAAAVPSAGQGGLVQAASARFASGATAALDLVLFAANPAGSTVTDKAAIAVAAADLPKVVGVMHLNDCTLLAAATENVCQNNNAAMPFGALAGGATTLYGALVARGALTPGSTTDLSVEIRVIQ